MTSGRIINRSTRACLFEHVDKTASMWERLRGLLGRSGLASDQGLFIEPCPSVHTFGMRFAIDVVFLDQEGTVKKVVKQLKPLRMAGCRRAHSTLELAAGQIDTKQIKTGDVLQWVSHYD